MNKKTFYFTFSILLLAPMIVLAVETPAQWFTGVLNRFLNIVVWPSFVAIAIGMFVWAGIKYLNAHGDPTKISEAHKAVIYGIIGIVIALLGFSIVGTLRTIILPQSSQNGGGGACIRAGMSCLNAPDSCCAGSFCRDTSTPGSPLRAAVCQLY